MEATAIMGKKQGKTTRKASVPPEPPEPPEPPDRIRKQTVLAMKGSIEWKAWLDRAARYCRVKNSALVDLTLIRFPEIPCVSIPLIPPVGQDRAPRITPGASPCTSTITYPSTNSSAGPKPSPTNAPGSAIRRSFSPPKAAPPAASRRPSVVAHAPSSNGSAKFNRSGPEALPERPHPGRPPRLSGPELLRFE